MYFGKTAYVQANGGGEGEGGGQSMWLVMSEMV